MGFQKGNKLGKRFSSEYQPAKKDTRPKLYRKFLVYGDMPAHECKAVVQSLMQYPREDLIKIMADTKTPGFVAVTARMIAEGDFKSLLDLMKFTYGTSLDITTNGKDLAPEPITIEVIHSADQVEDTDNTDI